ncbi:hypothetical protein [Spiroplasma endosymbiont of Labia minor]|uniref:hypothetical protein n=1 Tax=Spiroplasma endosymbiont of Labia minor TaxID=3066305 RepID=UPI0030D0F49D
MAAKNKLAIERAARNAAKQRHLQTRKKDTDPKPTKIKNETVKLSEVQEKFIWEKGEPVSGHNQNIYRRDIAGALLKIQEKNLESEFGWVLTLIDPKAEADDVNNIVAMHWMNAKIRRENGIPWMAPVVGSYDTKETYNKLLDHKVSGDALDKAKKTNLFQSNIVEARKINIKIRKG